MKLKNGKNPENHCYSSRNHDDTIFFGITASYHLLSPYLAESSLVA